MRSSNMTIQVEFLCGTTIESALKEAKKKATMLDLAFVKFDFNGITFSIGPNCNVEETVSLYRDRLTPHIVA